MTTLFGMPAPENQKEYCYLCCDNGTEVCPCKSYLDLPDDEKFDLDNISLDEDN